jgi:hypothetical protein
VTSETVTYPYACTADDLFAALTTAAPKAGWRASERWPHRRTLHLRQHGLLSRVLAMQGRWEIVATAEPRGARSLLVLRLHRERYDVSPGRPIASPLFAVVRLTSAVYNALRERERAARRQ